MQRNGTNRNDLGAPPGVQLVHLGNEREPVVIIDDFTGDVERLRALGIASSFQPGGVDYPGIRALADPSYLDVRRNLMMQIVQQIFGCSRSIHCEVCAFSLVTCREDELTLRQRIPHHDHSDAGRIAVMHYLSGPELGGTAFYRHRRTGFETISPDREAAYKRALDKDLIEFGEPAACYPYGDGERFEMIGEIEARPDRLILYRGRALHSGVIPKPEALSADPRTGRLTVNMFLFGT